MSSWIYNLGKNGKVQTTRRQNPTENEKKIKKLEKEVRILKMEREILKKAAAFFAKENQ